MAELVKGILYEGPPDYRQAVDSVSVKGDEGGLTLEYDGVVFDLVPQPLKA